MKKLALITLMMMGATCAWSQAELTFEKTTHDFGTFSEDDPVVTTTFKFKNTGDTPLIIHQAIASCGCTAPQYTQEPIKPGGKGEIKVTYNGAGRFPGKFRKTITIHSNAENDLVRLYIKGNMNPKAIDLEEAVEKAEALKAKDEEPTTKDEEQKAKK